MTLASSAPMVAFIEDMLRDTPAVVELRRMGEVIEKNRADWEAEDAQIEKEDE